MERQKVVREAAGSKRGGGEDGPYDIRILVLGIRARSVRVQHSRGVEDNHEP